MAQSHSPMQSLLHVFPGGRSDDGSDVCDAQIGRRAILQAHQVQADRRVAPQRPTPVDHRVSTGTHGKASRARPTSRSEADHQWSILAQIPQIHQRRRIPPKTTSSTPLTKCSTKCSTKCPPRPRPVKVLASLTAFLIRNSATKACQQAARRFLRKQRFPPQLTKNNDLATCPLSSLLTKCPEFSRQVTSARTAHEFCHAGPPKNSASDTAYFKQVSPPRSPVLEDSKDDKIRRLQAQIDDLQSLKTEVKTLRREKDQLHLVLQYERHLGQLRTQLSSPQVLTITSHCSTVSIEPTDNFIALPTTALTGLRDALKIDANKPATAPALASSEVAALPFFARTGKALPSSSLAGKPASRASTLAALLAAPVDGPHLAVATPATAPFTPELKSTTPEPKSTKSTHPATRAPAQANKSFNGNKLSKGNKALVGNKTSRSPSPSTKTSIGSGSLCGTAFASRNQLFTHLRGSGHTRPGTMLSPMPSPTATTPTASSFKDFVMKNTSWRGGNVVPVDLSQLMAMVSSVSTGIRTSLGTGLAV
ncbi:hypothetical protein QBC40DRAFT_321226 [Triangularia verruculosa]|uniref:Uncharacterized protein n=1 Tax=Triangularia verruculosa TaxID=2587418 RepID=A0AAN6X6Y8_9PEZI|nr:hypothetical protein QBC40DRAFT_321226 [Triangularia verruculosa]